MRKLVFAVFDCVSQEMTGPLFVMANDASARRVFQDGLTSEGSMLASHPEDFSLCQLGELDTVTGELIPVPKVDGQFGRQVVTGDFIMEVLRRRPEAREELING